jgi:hypothetical protein
VEKAVLIIGPTSVSLREPEENIDTFLQQRDLANGHEESLAEEYNDELHPQVGLSI